MRMPDDSMRRELLWGEVRTMTPAGFRHGVIASAIQGPMWRFVREHKLGVVCAAETGFILERDPDLVRAPDVSFIRNERLPEEEIPGFLEVAPDLAVEVLSPSDSFSDVEGKARCWLEHGSAEVWVADPQGRRVLIYYPDGTIRDLGGRDEIASEALLPGFRLAVADIFAR